METSPGPRPTPPPDPAPHAAVDAPTDPLFPATTGHRSPAPAGPPDRPPAAGRGRRRARPETDPASRRRTGPAPAGRADPAGSAATTPAPPASDGAADPVERSNRRRALLIALGITAAGSAAALVAGLLSWSPRPADPARPLGPAEADRLAAMRVTNQRDVRAGVRVTIGTGPDRTELVGWVDWARPLVYLDVSGPGAGAERGLVQATSTVVVQRPQPAAGPVPTAPPLVPPADGWRLREPPARGGIAAVRDLLLGLGAAQPDPVPAEARWLTRETRDGTPMDVLRAPLPADPDPARQPRLWLDRDARLHRLDGRLPDGRPVTVELARTDRPTLRPVDALGGWPGLPRALTDEEMDRLARLPGRLRASGGAALTLGAPLGPAANLTGAGWLSWTGAGAYLATGEADNPARRTLRRTLDGRVARAELPAADPADAPPPLPPPAGIRWSAPGPPGDEVDRLLAAALRAGAGPVPAGAAVRIRDDRLADRPVDVIEVPAGRTTLRYWIDRGGLLRRLELRTGRGVWSRLDLRPGPVPRLPAPERR
ncbi:hypothetical protein [Micromonospora sp. NPDC050495]|uniref:hypothetical protein n=1 Tax=Micromonospora sp. NPDC050495 TaxID=3154936 RepID=UPI0033C59FC1